MVRVNGIDISNNPKEIISIVLSMPPNLQYWGKEALIKIYLGALELAIEATEDMKGGKYTRFRNRMHEQLSRRRDTLHKRDREAILTIIYNEILKAEDKSLLRGFEIGNKYGDRVGIDSERQTISTPQDKLTMLVNRIIKNQERN